MPLDRIVLDTPRFTLRLFSFVDTPGIMKMLTVGIGLAVHYLFDQPSELDAAVGAGALVVADTITGFLAAWRQGHERTSYRLSRVITKTFGYLSVVLIGAVAEKTFGKSLPTVQAILWLIIATEGYSILENVEKMGLGRFKALRSILGKVMETETPKAADDAQGEAQAPNEAQAVNNVEQVNENV